jgi:hypothetical protein
MLRNWVQQEAIARLSRLTGKTISAKQMAILRQKSELAIDGKG